MRDFEVDGKYFVFSTQPNKDREMSKILDDVLETAKDLHDNGHITDESYAEFANLRRQLDSAKELEADNRAKREAIDINPANNPHKQP